MFIHFEYSVAGNVTSSLDLFTKYGSIGSSYTEFFFVFVLQYTPSLFRSHTTTTTRCDLLLFRTEVKRAKLSQPEPNQTNTSDDDDDDDYEGDVVTITHAVYTVYSVYAGCGRAAEFAYSA